MSIANSDAMENQSNALQNQIKTKKRLPILNKNVSKWTKGINIVYNFFRRH